MLAMKGKLLNEMRDPSSSLKLLFAIEAYSMRTDAPNIRRILHIGPPSSLDSELNTSYDMFNNLSLIIHFYYPENKMQ